MVTKTASLHLTTPPRPAAHPVVRHARTALDTAISRLAILLHDSRDALVSKETEMASLGVTWSSNLALDTELAGELADSRLHRAHGSDHPQDR